MNNVTGNIDVLSNLSIQRNVGRGICLVGSKEADGTATANQVFDITGMDDAAAKFGTGSPAPALVKVMIKNDPQIMLKGLAVDTANDATYAIALQELLKYPTIGAVVLDTITTTVVSALKTHLSTAEGEDIMRYGFVGIAGANNAALVSASGAIDCDRIFTFGPQVNDENGDSVTGVYAAAAVAAASMAMVKIDPAMPLNSLEIKGLGGVQTTLLRADRDALVAGGVSPLYMEDGVLVLYRLVSTLADANGYFRESTARFIADDVMASMTFMLRRDYKRTKNILRLLDSIRTSVIAVLDDKVAKEIIETYDVNDVAVIKDPTDNFGALLDYTIVAVTPLYKMTIRQHMKAV